MTEDFSRVTLVVAAAGLGTRMGNQLLPKCLVPFKGRQLIDWSTCAFMPFINKMVIIIRKEQQLYFDDYCRKNQITNQIYVNQDEPKGTASAVKIGLESVDSEWVLLVWGDHIGASQMPALELLTSMNNTSADFILPVVQREKPYVYFSSDSGAGSLTFHETKLGAPVPNEGLSDCGVFLFKKLPVQNFLCKYLDKSKTTTSEETNFLSLFEAMSKEGLVFHKVHFENQSLTYGINSVAELAMLDQLFQFEAKSE